MRVFVRGWTGNTSGRRSAISRSVFQNREDRRIVDILRTVQREDAISLRGDAEAREDVRGGGEGFDFAQAVDHHVADEMDAVRGDMLGREMRQRDGFGREEQGRVVVRDHPVQFLGHAPVEASKSRLHMNDVRPGRHAGHGAGRRGRDVADDEDRIRFPFAEHWDERPDDLPGLRDAVARTDAEIEIGVRDAELAEEHVGHLRVEMLARMHQRRRNAARLQRCMERRDLDEIRTRADEKDDVLHTSARYAILPSLASVRPGKNRSFSMRRMSFMWRTISFR